MSKRIPGGGLGAVGIGWRAAGPGRLILAFEAGPRRRRRDEGVGMRKSKVGWRDVNEDGMKMEVAAVREAGGYRFRYQLKGEDEWTEVKEPSLAMLEKLHEIMDLRYRRRRASHKELEVVSKMLGDRRDRPR